MRPLMYGLIATALILMLCISGCTSPVPTVTPTSPPTTPPTAQPTPMTTQAAPQTLTGVTWYLVAFDSGGGSLSVKPGTQITAFFDTQGKVSGSAGCNQYTASYESTLNGLSIGAPATTKMSCSDPAGIMNQETLYLTTIQGSSGYSISGNTLTVQDSGGKAILTYSTVPPYQMTPAPFTGTMWYLNSFVDVQGNFWTPGQAYPISLQFADDGKVSGNSGCNSYSGTYTVSGNSISMSGFAVTLMYCGEPGVMDLESTYLAVLPSMKVYKISGNELTLSDGTGKITMIYDTTK
ncbi:MAG: META domain-containing protein [Methanoregulaceae archaeon]|nr:META domain-containing protein [Methanoregulaceae archaeon]